MEDIKKVESWIEAIESSNLSKSEQEKRINALVDLWKFSSCYDGTLELSDVPGNFIKVDCGISKLISIHCEPFYIGKQHDITAEFLSGIEKYFENREEKYAGLYKIELNKALPNFNLQTLKDFQKEIIAAIKGEVILYQYVAKLSKFPAERMLFGNQNFTILSCGKSLVLDEVEKIETKMAVASNKWLVLMLNNLEDQCDFYNIENDLSEGFSSDFEKVFIFDFYKAEVVEVILKENIFPVPVGLVQVK